MIVASAGCRAVCALGGVAGGGPVGLVSGSKAGDEESRPLDLSSAHDLVFYVCICVQSSTRLAVPRECLGGLRPLLLLWSSIRASSPDRGEAALGI